MKKGTELKQHFHTCMPLFIALGDEIRLTNQPAQSAPSAWLKRPGDHRTDQPVAPGSFPPFEDLEDSRADRCPPGGNLQLLLSLNRRQHPETDAARTSAGIRAFHGRLNQDAYLSIF